MLHPLPLPLSSCLGCIPPLIGLPSLRFYAVGSSLFLLSVCFVYVLYFIATTSFAGYFLPVLFCMLSMLISDSRFDLVWFRLSCDHGWIRSGSVNVRKQQQQQLILVQVHTHNTANRVVCTSIFWCSLLSSDDTYRQQIFPHLRRIAMRPAIPDYSNSFYSCR